MNSAQEFIEWLISQSVYVVITQEDDGSGYIIVDITLPDGRTWEGISLQTCKFISPQRLLRHPRCESTVVS